MRLQLQHHLMSWRTFRIFLCLFVLVGGSWRHGREEASEEACDEVIGGVFCFRGKGGVKEGRFGSLAFAMKNRHFWGENSWILAGKARKCGRFWMFAGVPNPGKQSIWRQRPPSARKTKHEEKSKSSRFDPCAWGGFRHKSKGLGMVRCQHPPNNAKNFCTVSKPELRSQRRPKRPETRKH